jgi:membrane protein
MKKITLRSYWTIFRSAVTEFMNDRVLKLSAALAYYTVFSLAPMLVVIIALCSIFFGREAAQGQVFAQIDQFIGRDAAAQVQELLKRTALHHDNWFATTVGAITLLVGATGIFGEMQDSINFIWRLKAKPKKGFVKLLFNRLTSFSMLLVMGFILLVSLMLNTLLGTFFDHLKAHFPDALVNNMYIFNNIVMLAVTTFLFAFIFKALPDARIKWKEVWVSALVTALLFMLGKYLIGLYLEKFANISAYGAAGSFIVILLWVYYSSIILYFGAEFTQAYVRFKGSSIHPNKYAVWIENTVVEKRASDNKKSVPPKK